MKSICLSICKQGWLGVPLFFLGIASLAFSQLVQDADIDSSPPEQQIQFVDSKLKELSSRLEELQKVRSENSFESNKLSAIGNLNQLNAIHGSNDSRTLSIQNKINKADDLWNVRSKEVDQGMSSVEERLGEATLIFEDLKQNFAGRLEEASPALSVLKTNLIRTETEVDTLSTLSRNSIVEASNSFKEIESESNLLASQAVPSVPSKVQPPKSFSPKSKQITDAIKAKQAIPLTPTNPFGPSINANVGVVGVSNDENDNGDSLKIIDRLKSELAESKSLQTELSADSSDLQGDLRKAYREIVSLQKSLKETQLLAQELESTKNSLWKNNDGQIPTARIVGDKINRMEKELILAREDLRASRQTLLIEQERSNAMIRSVTNELDRTREELSKARTASITSSTDSVRLASLERELNAARRALQMAKMAPKDNTQESYLALQDELRKALAELTRMQIELNEKDALEAQLLKLQSSMEDFGDSPSQSASPEYVNKLLIDLNAAKGEVEKAKALNRTEMQNLVELVASLEDELKVSKIALKKTRLQFDASQEQIAQKEFEYAKTIQKLEEDAQLTQDSLRDASLGKLPAIPFVNEMERNLADSEARIKTLSDRFEAEQSKATELIDGLKVELDAAVVRQKRAIDQLGRSELELEGKELELQQAKQESKKLKEELEVVKVIAGQLEDLNTVLEETKRTQNSQSGSLDQIVDSLREELNQAKVELVFANEDREKVMQNSAKIISTLELQLEDTRNELLAVQENQADQTNESKELVIDLKYELDEARREISRMKSAGLGESIETKQAVSQLEEALGTIKILQESLDQSEQVNLEVDNLRTELANSMEYQLREIERSDDEKNLLRRKAEDLEAEIQLLRNQGTGAGVQFKKSNAALSEELAISKAQIAKLEKRAGMAEDSDVLSIIDLEEELNEEKNRNLALQQEIFKNTTARKKTVELLETELAKSTEQLEAIEAREELLKSKIASLESEISQTEPFIANEIVEEDFSNDDNTAIINDLKAELLDAQNQLSKMGSKIQDNISKTADYEAFAKLEGELAGAENTINELIQKLESKEQKQLELENELETAVVEMTEKEAELEIARSISNSEINKADDSELLRLKEDLKLAQNTIDELILKSETGEKEKIELENQFSELIDKIEKLENSQSPTKNKELENGLILEIENLKSLLLAKDKTQQQLEEELENALIEMTDKEAELEMAISLNEQMELLTKKLDDAEKKLSDVESDKNLSEKNIISPKISDEEKIELEKEIDDLKSQLEIAKTENLKTEVDKEMLEQLKNELQDAVAESVELQTELEETKSRLASLESNDAQNSKSRVDEEMLEQLENALQDAVTESVELQTELEETKSRLASLESNNSPTTVSQSPELQELLKNAKDAENQAQERISDLTNALRSSEELRKEMEFLLTEVNQPKTKNDDTSSDLASDPRFIAMQKELLLLQQDLLYARDLKDPRVQDLENQLLSRQDDNQRLNNEFKGAMSDFSNIKEQLAMLEEENRRLQNLIPSKNSKIEDNIARTNLQNRVNELAQENSILRSEIGEKDNRVSRLREDLVRAQMVAPGIQPDTASLRGQIVRLEGAVQQARDDESRSKLNLQRSDNEVKLLNQKLALMDERLRETESRNRGLPSTISSYAEPTVAVRNISNAADSAEIARLREQNQRLQNQLLSNNTIPQRDALDRKIRDLNQKNLTAQIQLDQERSRVEDLKSQLAEARNIKQGVLERGQSSNLKVQLLNEELGNAKSRISSLEDALLAARGAIEVLKNGKNSPTTFTVSSPNSRRVRNYDSISATPINSTSRMPVRSYEPQSSISPQAQKFPVGDASLQLNAEVQFLNNRNRPAGFTEFFLSRDDLDTVIRRSNIRVPVSQGIDSAAELWARSVQRGYRYPGVSSAIRNSLANSSLSRLKTNSIGEANIDNIKAGKYYIIGASTLGQVGVVWSKSIVLKAGTNQLELDLRDAAWAE